MDDWFIYSKIFVDEILDFVVGSYWGKQKGRFFCHHPQSFSLKIEGRKNGMLQHWGRFRFTAEESSEGGGGWV